MPEKFHSVLQSRAIISDANGTVALMSQNQGGNQMICQNHTKSIWFNGSLYLLLPCPTQFDHFTNLVLPIYKVSQINSTNLISSTNLAPEFSSAST